MVDCFLECEVGPWKAIFWEVGVGYLGGKASVIPLEGGTLVPDEQLLCKTGTVPGSGLVLNVAAVFAYDECQHTTLQNGHHQASQSCDRGCKMGAPSQLRGYCNSKGHQEDCETSMES